MKAFGKKQKKTAKELANSSADLGDGIVNIKDARFKRISKKYVVLIIAIFVVLLGLIGLLIQKNRQSKQEDTGNVKAQNVCATDSQKETLRVAVTNLSPAKYNELKNSVDKIMNTPDFEKDPNCLYPVVTYYTNIGDLASAKRYLTTLESVHGSSYKFDETFPSNVTLETIKQQVTQLEEVQNINKSNAIYYN